MKATEKARRLSSISEMADSSFMGGIISHDEHREIKGRLTDLQSDNLFKAMESYARED